MTMNITRQLNASISPVRIGGARVGPIYAPDVYTPLGVPRSFTSNQSLTERVADGKHGASVAPRPIRDSISRK